MKSCLPVSVHSSLVDSCVQPDWARTSKTFLLVLDCIALLRLADACVWVKYRVMH